jgi:hypothetical protein
MSLRRLPGAAPLTQPDRTHPATLLSQGTERTGRMSEPAAITKNAVSLAAAYAAVSAAATAATAAATTPTTTSQIPTFSLHFLVVFLCCIKKILIEKKNVLKILFSFFLTGIAGCAVDHPRITIIKEEEIFFIEGASDKF